VQEIIAIVRQVASEFGTSEADYRAAIESISRDGANAVMVLDSPGRGGEAQKSNPRDLHRSLRVGADRPHNRSAQERYELAPQHTPSRKLAICDSSSLALCE
jgi:hypothetical protein